MNAAGTWAREVGRLAGLDLPIVPMEHQYLVTEAIPEIAALGRELPLLREPDVSYYLRQEAQGLLLGPYERDARPFGVGGIPPGFGADLLPPDPERLRAIVEGAMARVPALARAGVARIVNGPITYTPDGNPLLGPAFGLPGLLARLRIQLRDHAGGRGRAVPGRVDRGGAAVHRSLGAGPAALRRLRDRALRGRPLHRHLRGRVRDRLSAGRPPARPAGPDEPALRPLPRRRRGLRRPERLGAAVLVRARRDGAARPAELPPDQLVRRGRPGGPRGPRAGGAPGAVELLEVRGPRPGRGGLPRPALREPAAAPRPDRALPAPHGAGHDRVRRDRDAARARALPRPERRGRRAARPRLASVATRRRTGA